MLDTTKCSNYICSRKKAMKEFDYKQYLTEGWMFEESGTSITGEQNLYQWVEDHCKSLDDLLRLNPEELREPISVAKEENLSPREFIEAFVEEYGDWVDIAEMLGLSVARM